MLARSQFSPTLAHVRKVYVLVFFLSEDDPHHPWLSPYERRDHLITSSAPVQATAAPASSVMNSRRLRSTLAFLPHRPTSRRASDPLGGPRSRFAAYSA